MPYSASFKFVPEVGHQLEVRQAMEEAARRFQMGSLRVSVVSELAGSDQFAVTGFFQFEALTDYDEFLKSPNEHQVKASEDLQTKLRGNVRKSSSSIMQIIKPLQSPLRRQGYAQIVTRTPLPGKTKEVSEMSLELGGQLLAQGHNVAVSVQLAGPNAGECALTTGFAELDEWEKFRSDNSANADMQKALAAFAPILAAPATITVYSILIPAPPTEHTYSDG